MISEPEPADGQGFSTPEPLEPPADSDRQRPGRHWIRLLRSTPRWRWALGGTLAASALWAVGLYVYADSVPDMRGYVSTKDLCADAQLDALADVLGEREPGPTSSHHEHPALDQAVCDVRWNHTLRGSHTTTVTYELHKKTDPEPEFEPRVKAQYSAAALSVEEVPGMGEKAFLMKWQEEYQELKMLDGGAVLTLAISGTYLPDGEGDDLGGAPSPARDSASPVTRAKMIAAMKELMTELKR